MDDKGQGRNKKTQEDEKDKAEENGQRRTNNYRENGRGQERTIRNRG